GLVEGAIQIGPVFRVLLGEPRDDLAVDSVHQDQTALGGRVLGRVDEDPPGRAAEKATPAELSRGVAHGETHLFGGSHQGVSLVDVEVPAGHEVVATDGDHGDARREDPEVHQHRIAVSGDEPRDRAGDADQDVQVAGHPTSVVVGEDVGTHELRDVEV